MLIPMLSLILLVLGFVLFLLSGIGNWPVTEPRYYRLIGFGLACWVLAEILRIAAALGAGGAIH